MFARGPAVQLVDADLLPAQVVRVPCVVLNINPEISRTLLRLLQQRVRQEEAERETEREKREEDSETSAQVLIVMCAVAFMGSVSKKLCFRG